MPPDAVAGVPGSLPRGASGRFRASRGAAPAGYLRGGHHCVEGVDRPEYASLGQGAGGRGHLQLRGQGDRDRRHRCASFRVGVLRLPGIREPPADENGSNKAQAAHRLERPRRVVFRMGRRSSYRASTRDSATSWLPSAAPARNRRTTNTTDSRNGPARHPSAPPISSVMGGKMSGSWISISCARRRILNQRSGIGQD